MNLARIAPLLGILSMLAVPAASAFGVYISGKVIERAASKPLPRAMVALDRLVGDQPAERIDFQVCLVNGSFVLKAPVAGPYRLKVSREDQVLFQERISVPGSGLSGLRVPLGAGPAVVPTAPAALPSGGGDPWRIRLLSPEGTPVPPGTVDAWLEVYWASRHYGAGGSMAVAADGSLTLALPRPDSSTSRASALVVATLRHPSLGWGRLEMHGWPTGQEPLRPGQEVVLRGVVVDRQDQPLPGVPVLCTPLIRVGCVLRRAERISHCAAVTDAMGHFHVTVPCRGTYDVRAQIPGGLVCHRPFWLSMGHEEVLLSARDDPVAGALKPPDVIQD